MASTRTGSSSFARTVMQRGGPLSFGLLLASGLLACGSPGGARESGGDPAKTRWGERAPIPAARSAAPPRPAPDLTRLHPFGVQDMVRMERVGEPIPSPDGQWILFTRQSWDPDANQKTTNLWLVSPDGATTRALTTAKGVHDTSPIWTPDGKGVLFVSSRDGGGKAWYVRVDGGEPKKLLELPVDVDNLRLAPGGQRLAFSAEVYPDAATLEETAKRDGDRAKSPVKARSYEKLMVRHWDSWFEGKRSHLFVVPMSWDADDNPAINGAPLDLMKGVDADCPTKPFGGGDDFAISPDGQEVCYTAQLGADMAWSTDLDLYVVPIGGGAAKCITDENPATDKSPLYAPDGATILYLAMARPGFESDRLDLEIYDRAGGTTRPLAANWDRSVGQALFTPSGRHLLVTAEEEARTRVFAIEIASGAVKRLLTEHTTDALALLPAHGDRPVQLVYRQDSFMAPAELFKSDLDGLNRLRLTRVNDARIDLTMRSQPEDFFFAGANDEKVHAWIVKPVGFEPGKRYPLAFVIHGGPQGAMTDHFHYRWNLESYAGAGYAVMTINFHGSTGFGQAFTDSISGDWGGKPFVDLMKGLDAALAKFDWIDGSRVGALGASYGGWMINWINGHTDRFQCLVCHDGGFDESANYFTTEELWFPEWEFKGVPWEHPELYAKFSPSNYVADWRTPTLVVHSANDFRLIDAEGIAAFTALQRRAIPAKFLWFPDENHWVLKTANSIHWHDSVLEWLDRWLKN